MSEARHEFHSPLSLLREWRDRADGAPLREFLITGYTMDLVFLERHCMSIARALGARITVLADSGQAVHEPVDVRHAGRTYQHGHGSCRGAFHPKLVVLVGDEDVWVAIGSGNPTMSGWGHNHELWLVLRASRQRGPAALRDLGAWLVDLPDVVAMPSWIRDTIVHIGRLVTPEEIDDSLTNLRVFGNLRHSVVEQLPADSVRSLRMTAPFFDARAAAVSALITRLSPDEVIIAVQPTLAQYDGQALADAAAAAERVEFRHMEEDRTRHGKLVEWTVDDTTTALVGSANLSATAMLATTASGGNCELVVTCTVGESLLPEGTAVDAGTIRAVNTIPVENPERTASVVTLLGARRVPDTVVVELITNTREPVTIETSPDGTPNTWMTAHVVSVADDLPTAVRFLAPESLSGAVRAWVEPAGERIFSSVVFLTDTSRCLPRDDEVEHSKPVFAGSLGELFTDPVLSRRFDNDFLRLLGHVQENRVVRTASLRTTIPTQDNTSAEDRWGAWVRGVESVLGSGLTGLVFPGDLMLPESRSGGWSVGPDADETALAEDEDEDVIESLPVDTGSSIQALVIPPSQRQKCRGWAGRWVRAVTTQPRPWLVLRMTVACLYVHLLAAGVWGADDSWRAELSALVQALVPTEQEDEDMPGRNMSFLSSLMAVCLALLFQDASSHGGGEHDLVSKAAWDKAKAWAAFAEPQLIVEYLHEPKQEHARVASEAEVLAVLAFAEAVEDDPHAELRAAFELEGLDVEFVDGVWVTDGEFRNPRRTAAKVATMAGPTCAALARNAHKACLILRSNRTLAITESTVPRWRIYQLTPLSTPLSTLGGDEGLPSTGANHPLEPVPSRIHDLVEAVGVDISLLLAALHAFSI